jgi:hypothetical protein
MGKHIFYTIFKEISWTEAISKTGLKIRGYATIKVDAMKNMSWIEPA